VTATVLVHGGGFDSRCWDELVPLLDGTVVAVDLPGRGSRPRSLAEVTLDDFAAAVVADIVDRDLTDVALVGHSLAGCTLPLVADRIPERLARLVFVSCTVPSDGQSVIDTLDPELRDMARSAATDAPMSTLPPELAEALFCNDMTEAQTRSTIERLVPEAPRVIAEPVRLSGLRHGTPRTYVRLLRDTILVPDKQDMMIANLGGATVIELDAAHMAMISRPQLLADALTNGTT
jgi:pimeloyl-ACP methyl ester carboxylesterase